jgi:hypothetical protein
MPIPDYQGFAAEIMKEWYEHWDVESSVLIGTAVKYGLIVPIPGGFNSEVHTPDDSYPEPGDTWYKSNFTPPIPEEELHATEDYCRTCPRNLVRQKFEKPVYSG